MPDKPAHDSATPIKSPDEKKIIKRLDKPAWWEPRWVKVVIILALLILIPAIGVFGASKFKPKRGALGSVLIHVYDVTSGAEVNLDGVTIHVQAIGAPTYQCNAPNLPGTNVTYKTTDSTGLVTFGGCPSGTKGKKRYAIRYYAKPGYVHVTGNSFQNDDGPFLIIGGAPSTRLNLYMQQATAPRTAPAIAKLNVGNIIDVSQTHHAHDYGKLDPDPGWISNQPNSYYIGSIYVGWSVDLVKLNSSTSQYGTVSDAGYMFGLIRRPDGTQAGCGWIEPNTVSTSTLQATNNPCKVHPFLKHVEPNTPESDQMRTIFGEEFNCSSATVVKCNAPITVPQEMINLNCNATLYKNYFTNNNYSTGEFADPVGVIDLTKGDALRYRYTTHDHRAAVIANANTPLGPGYGWGFIDRTCINGTPTGVLQ